MKSLDKRPLNRVLLAIGFSLAAIALSGAKRQPAARPGPFKYVGGTGELKQHCLGDLGLTSSSMIFTCPEGSITIPYNSILLMQYRANISRKVRRFNLRWFFKPWEGGGNQNRYFTVVYSAQREKRVMVLAVSPDDMRPYLAEIDLKIGRRVEVQDHEKYY